MLRVVAPLLLAFVLPPAALAQPQPRPQKLAQKRAPKGLERTSPERLARDSKALKNHVTANPELTRRLVDRIAREGRLDPALARRLELEGDEALKDRAFVDRILAQDAALQVALEDPDVRRRMDEELSAFHARSDSARDAVRRGDHRQAAEGFAAAAVEADRLGNAVARSAAQLAEARALEAVDRAAKTRDEVTRALALYDQVIAGGDERQQTLARNNKGVALLRIDEADQAVATLSAINPQALDAAERPALRFNLGRARELTGADAAALAEYRAAIADWPTFRPAVDGAFRVLRRSDSDASVDEALALGSRLIEAGAGRTATRELRRSLHRWSDSPRSPALCEALLRGYGAASLGAEEYRRRERAALLDPTVDSPLIEAMVAALDRAFDEEMKVSGSAARAREAFPDFGLEESHRAWSVLLKRAADDFDARGDSEQALARYLTSWNLDPTHTEAMVYVADLLQKNPPLLEAHGDVFADLMGRVFEEKGRAYLVPHKTKEDWLNLMRYHVLLGTIFEQRGEYGSSGRVASAIFQFEHAIRAEAQVRRRDPDVLPSPGLHFRLARSLLGPERAPQRVRARAVDEYLSAAEGFLALGNLKDARLAIEGVRPPSPLSEAQRLRLREVVRALRQAERPR